MDIAAGHELKTFERQKYEQVWDTEGYKTSSGDRVMRREAQVRAHLRACGVNQVVSLGMGSGRLETALSDEFVFVGVDIASNCRSPDCPVPLVVAGLWEDLDIGTYDAVICTDVLEHIPEEFLPAVIANIERLAPHGYLAISLRESAKRFPWPLHLTVKPVEWWNEIIPFAEVREPISRGWGVAKY